MNQRINERTFCSHANEVPSVCLCIDDCSCKSYTCKPKNTHNERLKIDSGNVEIQGDKLTSFLYELIRDYLPPGDVEKLVRNAYSDTKYCNGWLAKYAQDLARRLRDEGNS